MCIPILTYGCELSRLTKTELQIFERLHRKILRSIQGLPTRCPSTALLALVGMQPVEDIIKQRKLSFILSTVTHPTDSLARRVFEARARSECSSSIVADFETVLSDLNLPKLSHLLVAQPRAPLWKRHVKNHLATRGLLEFIEDCTDYHASAWVERTEARTNRVETVEGTPTGSFPLISSGDSGAPYCPQDAQVVLFVHVRHYFLAKVPHSLTPLSQPCSGGFSENHDD